MTAGGIVNGDTIAQVKQDGLVAKPPPSADTCARETNVICGLLIARWFSGC